MKVCKIIAALLMAVTLFGCTAGTNNQSTGIPLGTPVANPQSGKASIVGQMVAMGSSAPMQETLVRLAPIHGEGKDSIYIFNDVDDPGAWTDKKGVFVFENVEPGSYAVLIMNENSDYLTINETSEKILTVDAAADKVNNMGKITVDTSNPKK